MRPTKYSKERVEKITEAIRDLKGRVSAAKAGGISFETFCQWMKKYPEFSESIKKAEEHADAYGEEYALKAIFSKMRDHWQAAAWFLERTKPEKYRERKSYGIGPEEDLDEKLLRLVNKKEKK